MKALGTIATLTVVAGIAGCAAKPAKPDAYVEATKRKNAEIARLTYQIDSLSHRADVSFLKLQIDSLEILRSVAKSSLGGIGQAAQAQKQYEFEHQETILGHDTAAMRWERESKERKGH